VRRPDWWSDTGFSTRYTKPSRKRRAGAVDPVEHAVADRQAVDEAALRQSAVGMNDQLVGVAWVGLGVARCRRRGPRVARVAVDQHHRAFEQRRYRGRAAHQDAAAARDGLAQVGDVAAVGRCGTVVGIGIGRVAAAEEALRVQLAKHQEVGPLQAERGGQPQQVALFAGGRQRMGVANAREQPVGLVQVAPERMGHRAQRLAATLGAHERRKARQDLPAASAAAGCVGAQRTQLAGVGKVDEFEFVTQRLGRHAAGPRGLQRFGALQVLRPQPLQRSQPRPLARSRALAQHPGGERAAEQGECVARNGRARGAVVDAADRGLDRLQHEGQRGFAHVQRERGHLHWTAVGAARRALRVER
jgi:hypothetical protein